MNIAHDVQFIVAGEKQMEVKFPDNCEYLGRLPYDKMPDVYNQADLVILTSETEGMPLVILEAYACDIPVLTHKDIFPSELPVYGIVQSHNDPKEYMKSINRIKNGDYEKIDARTYVEKNLSWERFGQKMDKEFRTALRNHSSES